jgi:hypothetical protein
MKKRVIKTNQLINEKIRKTCERIPIEKRKQVVLGLCILFAAFFSYVLWDSFHSKGVQKLIKIEHITPLDLPQDTLINHFKNWTNGYK